MKQVILASSSPRRKQLLEKAEISFAIEVSNFEEYMDLNVSAHELTKQLSLGKAQTIAQKHIGEDVVILAADTIVEFNGEYLGKPSSYDEAENVLKRLRGNMHKIVTGFTIIDLPEGKIMSGSDEGKLFFKNFSDQLITEYIDKNTYSDKAGGYAIQELDERYIDHIEGDRDTIIGLPVEKIKAILAKL